MDTMLWDLRQLGVPSNIVIYMDYIMFLICLVGVVYTLVHHDLFAYFGFRQLLNPHKKEVDEGKKSNGKLIDKGLYGFVRHPMYTFTLLGMVCTPVMNVDRMIIFISSYIYLLFGVPIEERKLTQLFGRSYEEYRRKVPAVIPKFN